MNAETDEQELKSEVAYLFGTIDMREAIHAAAMQEPYDNRREHEAYLLRSYRKAKQLAKS